MAKNTTRKKCLRCKGLNNLEKKGLLAYNEAGIMPVATACLLHDNVVLSIDGNTLTKTVALVCPECGYIELRELDEEGELKDE